MSARRGKRSLAASPVELLRQRLTPPHETPAKVRQRLVNAARGGGITLVLGAGVSIPRKIPSWDQLAQAVWREAFGNRASPWKQKDGVLAQSLPQFLPIVFELASWEFKDDKKFVKVLRKKLYEHAEFPSSDANFENSSETLAVLARLILQEYKRGPERRITSIISLNADDLVEQAVVRVARERRRSYQMQIVRHIARSTHAYIGKRTSPFMPVYHLHGFLPSGRVTAYRGNYQYMLVFTDEQYWNTSASPASFASCYELSAKRRCLHLHRNVYDGHQPAAMAGIADSRAGPRFRRRPGCGRRAGIGFLYNDSADGLSATFLDPDQVGTSG